MESVVSRLEAIAARLEQTEARLSSQAAPANAAVGASRAGPSPTQQPGASAPAAPAGAAGGAAAAYQQQVMGQVRQLLDCAESIGGEVLNATRTLVAAFEKEGTVVQAFERCQKPSDAELQALVAPVGEQLVAVGALAEGGPRSKYVQHFKLLAEAAQGLTWVVYTGPACGMPPPAQHVQETWSAAEFYGNKVLMEWRAKDPNHVTWVGAVKAAMLALRDFCKQHFPQGPTWNASGVPVSQFKPGAAAPAPPAAAAPAPAAVPAAAAAPKAPAAPSRPAGGPPPPPPLPPGGPGSLLDKQQAPAAAKPAAPAAPSGAGMSALFADINKGEGVTAGLRKVTADMKTKNRADRSGTVPAAAGGAGAAKAAAGAAVAGGKPAGAASAGPPRIELEQDRKWVVEHQEGNQGVVISDTQPKHTVYIYGCSNSTIQIKGKVNAISMDKCRRVGLVFEDVVAVCEVVNCISVEVQCTGFVPTVAIDKCDGCQVYLSRASLGTDITTAKSSEVNVIVPGEREEDDPLETAIPEQFITRYRGGRWVTEPTSHSAA